MTRLYIQLYWDYSTTYTCTFHKTNAWISLHLHIIGDKQVNLHVFHMSWTDYIWNWTEIYIFVVRVVHNLRKMTNMRRYTKCLSPSYTGIWYRYEYMCIVCLKCTCRKFYWKMCNCNLKLVCFEKNHMSTPPPPFFNLQFMQGPGGLPSCTRWQFDFGGIFQKRGVHIPIRGPQGTKTVQ